MVNGKANRRVQLTLSVEYVFQMQKHANAQVLQICDNTHTHIYIYKCIYTPAVLIAANCSPPCLFRSSTKEFNQNVTSHTDFGGERSFAYSPTASFLSLNLVSYSIVHSNINKSGWCVCGFVKRKHKWIVSHSNPHYI